MAQMLRERSAFADNYGEYPASRRDAITDAGGTRAEGPFQESPEITRARAPSLVDPNDNVTIEVNVQTNAVPTFAKDEFFVRINNQAGEELAQSRSDNLGSGETARFVVSVPTPLTGGITTQYEVELFRKPKRPGLVNPDTATVQFQVNELPEPRQGNGNNDQNGNDNQNDNDENDNSNQNGNNNQNNNQNDNDENNNPDDPDDPDDEGSFFSNLSTDQKVLLLGGGVAAFALLGGSGGGRRRRRPPSS